MTVGVARRIDHDEHHDFSELAAATTQPADVCITASSSAE
jgi:hypothetical protein